MRRLTRNSRRTPIISFAVPAISAIALITTFVLSSSVSAETIDGPEIERSIRAYADAVNNQDVAAFEAAACPEEVAFTRSHYRSARKATLEEAWKEPLKAEYRTTVGEVTSVEVKGASASANVTSSAAGYRTTDKVDLVRVGNDGWKVCPSRGKTTNVTPAAVSKSLDYALVDHISPPSTIPSNYVFDPNCARMASGSPGGCDAYQVRHDYCTMSPDSYPTVPGRTVTFQGPCARHDMCYDSNPTSPPNFDKPQARYDCDDQFGNNMAANCNAELAGFLYLAQRGGCLSAVALYVSFVWYGGGSGPNPYPPTP